MGSKKRISADDTEHKAKRTKSPGVRVIGGRIYDSENGKTCHQCRQKTMDFAALCTNTKGAKPCTIKFCHKCLLNRYGEKAEEVALVEGWNCPRCRGICNCSFCMKKKGLKPTGLLAHTAKATGFSSVSEMLLKNGYDNHDHDNTTMDNVVSPKKKASENKESVMISPRKQGKENSITGNNKSNLNLQSSTPKPDEKKSKKTKLEELKETKLEELKETKRAGLKKMKRAGLKKMKREGLKEICNGSRVDSKCSKKSSPMKPNYLEEMTNKKSEANGKSDALTPEKSKKRTLKDAPSDVSRPASPKVARGRNSARHEDAKVKEKHKKSSKNVCPHLITTKDTKEEKDDVHKGTKITEDVKYSKLEVKNKTLAISQDNMKCTVNNQNTEFDSHVSLPLGSMLTTVADLELAMEDVGHALQFLEFCAAFGKALNLKKGHAESVLKDLKRERRRCRVHDSPTVRFHNQLLSFILKNMDEEPAISSSVNDKSSWLRDLKKCMSASQFKLNDMAPEYFDGDNDCYDNLDFSRKLRLLNYLCDEALSTTELRSWIDEQNSKFVEKQKDAKEKIAALKDKEKQAKHKLRDEWAKALIAQKGIPLSISEHDAIVSQIKSDVAQAQSERLAELEMASKRRKISDAVRTDPIILDADGRVFWKLKGFAGEGCVLLQDTESWEAFPSSEKWSVYEGEREQEIEKYISVLKVKRLRLSQVAPALPSGGIEANI